MAFIKVGSRTLLIALAVVTILVFGWLSDDDVRAGESKDDTPDPRTTVHFPVDFDDLRKEQEKKGREKRGDRAGRTPRPGSTVSYPVTFATGER
ncbi:hypothetical protein [Streptomyces boncukensis]|uniref:Uncharacterized protein n=1 Tax=Streptomyces boncukensis TaxID=2711219 RepID=A0A6G4WY31_9ACTN|nr:hypothetical protein [Streptomyces boncukensis]NGO70018.1 hypothetical protein [Streptomyces boncukensis]